jgi:hypothetical protein
MLARLLLTICLLATACICGTAQALQVRSASSRQPLPYATIVHVPTGWAAVANGAGQLVLPAQLLQHAQPRWRISYTGYQVLDTTLQQPTTVYLQPQPDTLRPVAVYPCSSYEPAQLKNHHRPKADFYLGSAGDQTLLMSWAAHVPNSSGRRGWLQQVHFWIDNLAAPKAVMKTPFRLRFLEWDSARQQPGQPLSWQELVVQPNGGEMVTAELDSLHIPLPAEGLVVAIDFFDAGPAYRYEASTHVHMPNGRDTVRIADRYGPSIRATTFDSGVHGFYFNFKTSRWFPFFFGQRPAAPLVRVEVRQCRL